MPAALHRWPCLVTLNIPNLKIQNPKCSEIWNRLNVTVMLKGKPHWIISDFRGGYLPMTFVLLNLNLQITWSWLSALLKSYPWIISCLDSVRTTLKSPSEEEWRAVSTLTSLLLWSIPKTEFPGGFPTRKWLCLNEYLCVHWTKSSSGVTEGPQGGSWALSTQEDSHTLPNPRKPGKAPCLSLCTGAVQLELSTLKSYSAPSGHRGQVLAVLSSVVVSDDLPEGQQDTDGSHLCWRRGGSGVLDSRTLLGVASWTDKQHYWRTFHKCVPLMQQFHFLSQSQGTTEPHAQRSEGVFWGRGNIPHLHRVCGYTDVVCSCQNSYRWYT